MLCKENGTFDCPGLPSGGLLFLQVHTGSFRDSVIHRTLTWTTWSLTFVRDHSCVYTHGGWTHRQRVSTTFLIRKNSLKKMVLMKGFEPQVFGSRVRRCTNWAPWSPHVATTSPIAQVWPVGINSVVFWPSWNWITFSSAQCYTFYKYIWDVFLHRQTEMEINGQQHYWKF